VRKVHFRDPGMIRQIEEKVTNRLRQVTYAIRQDGANQVNIITSTAERQAAIEFAKAAALRPQIVGAAIASISNDHEVCETLFSVLEAQRMAEGDDRLILMPKGGPGTAATDGLMTSIMAAATPTHGPRTQRTP
jgi:hypothetical protein